MMIEGETEGVDEATFCEAVLVGLESVSVKMLGIGGLYYDNRSNLWCQPLRDLVMSLVK